MNMARNNPSYEVPHTLWISNEFHLLEEKMMWLIAAGEQMSGWRKQFSYVVV